MGGRGGSSGISAGGLQKISPDSRWAYQPDDMTDISDMRKNPIPFVGVGKDMELAETFENDTIQTAYKSNTSVKISELETLQPFVLESGIKNYQSWDSSERPYVIQYNGQKYLIDGNHRVAQAKLRGDKTISVDISVQEKKKKK
jgi:hypothetical protein